MAVDEILALKQRYKEASGLMYTFECEGQQVQAAFVTASLGQRPPNAYQIELIPPATTVAEGQCYIIDRHRKRQGAEASTQQRDKEKRTTIQTITAKP